MNANHLLKGCLLVFLCLPFTTFAQLKYKISSAGAEPWQEQTVGSGWDFAAFRFHDFDGDGKTDVFVVKNGQWLFSSAGDAAWETLNSTFVKKNIGHQDLRFGDFNGDGKMDVFLELDGYWGYVSGGRGKFIRLQKAITSLDKIGFGDFNGDGKTDIFKQN